MNIETIIDEILKACRYALLPDARVELSELLTNRLDEGESAYTVAHEICDFLEISRKEFSYPIEVILRPEFDK